MERRDMKKELKKSHEATFKSLEIIMKKLKVVNDNVNKLRQELKEK